MDVKKKFSAYNYVGIKNINVNEITSESLSFLKVFLNHFIKNTQIFFWGYSKFG